MRYVGANGVPNPIGLVMAAFHAHLNHRVGCLELDCRLFACDGWEEARGRYVCPCGYRVKTAVRWRRHLRDAHGAARRQRGRWWLRHLRTEEIKPRR